MKSMIQRCVAMPPATIAILIVAILMGAQPWRASASQSVPLKLRGVLTPDPASFIACKERCVALGCVPGDVFQCDLAATDVGLGTYFGRYHSTFDLTVTFFVLDSPLFEGDVPPYLAPIAGAGTLVQINADGSMVTWATAFPVDDTGAGYAEITGGTSRFEGATGWVISQSVVKPDGTFSYEEEGQITFAR